MNNQKNKTLQETERRLLPFFIEFVKFSTGFVGIIALALLALRFVGGGQ
jgi:hypothetical protein